MRAETDNIQSRLPRQVFRSSNGGEVSGVNIDFVIYLDNVLLVSGWLLNVRDSQITFDQISYQDLKFSTFERTDVAQGYDVAEECVQGFIGIVAIDDINPIGSINLTAISFDNEVLAQQIEINDAYRSGDVVDFFESNQDKIALLVRHLVGKRNWMRILVGYLRASSVASGHGECAGYIETARGVAGIGGLVIGWSVCQTDSMLLLVSDDGYSTDLTKSARWDRNDIIDSLFSSYGRLTRNAGFVQMLDLERIDSAVYLIGCSQSKLVILSTCEWKQVSEDPVAFAKWAFELQSTGRALTHRLVNHDGVLIRRLMQKVTSKTEHENRRHIESQTFGDKISCPKITIGIPLYGRFDFMSNQLLEFSSDPFIKDHCEIVYFIDDPAIIDDVIEASHLLWEYYRVSFKVSWTGANGGFAAATNDAIRQGHAPLVLMLNSDVIPIESGWLESMVNAFDTGSRIGILGARLLYPNGGIQHEGMVCRWEPSWAAFLNKHPKVGYAPDSANLGQIRSVPLVTAACLLTSREIFEAVGGLDEGFLIGDFEDSDFCFRVRQRGYSIACFQTNSLIHLERQSFSGIGRGYFRECVTRLNALIHQERWGAFIKADVTMFGEI